VTGTIVVLADPGGSQRQLLERLGSLALLGGWELLPRSQVDLVAEVSILVGADGLVRVTPDRPILWLWPHPAPSPQEAEDRFLRMETLSAARSIAMLSESAVFNRPTPFAPVGALPPSRALAMRVAHRGEPSVRAESFGTDGPAPPEPEGEFYDYSTGRASFGRPASSGPYRWRAGGSGRHLTVHVVGGRVIGVRPEEEIAARSAALAERFGVDFVAVTWLIADEPVLARMTTELTDHLIHGRLPEIAGAIWSWILAHRLVRA
jgi:hypothetical protein